MHLKEKLQLAVTVRNSTKTNFQKHFNVVFIFMSIGNSLSEVQLIYFGQNEDYTTKHLVAKLKAHFEDHELLFSVNLKPGSQLAHEYKFYMVQISWLILKLELLSRSFL